MKAGASGPLCSTATKRLGRGNLDGSHDLAGHLDGFHLRLRPQRRRQALRGDCGGDDDAGERRRKRSEPDRATPPAPQASREADHVRRFAVGARCGRFQKTGQPHLGGGLDFGEPPLDRHPQFRRRGHGLDHRMQLAEPPFPVLHERRESRVRPYLLFGLFALGGVERAEHIFGRKTGSVFVRRHDSRHSRMSASARRSWVLTVFTGRSNCAAIWSRLMPL